ncbi:hypothetical protein Nepgr_014972 [Nepenthes gracilis]|uniref:Uncharacterized protein n=1 Tax=Nepenthes gracilis TaxID=150966 RepID=A0AAD3SM83_NEPGR|nr:hypothetical protein Nepgr_014972 [Nepenthes gracilis]
MEPEVPLPTNHHPQHTASSNATATTTVSEPTLDFRNSTINADGSPSLSPFDDYYVDSNCSTPYVSAPSSPGRATGGGFFYSAPASPMHFVILKSSRSYAIVTTVPSPSDASSTGSFEFEFSAGLDNSYDSAAKEIGPMSSADELFLNGQIRPMKLSSHLQRPQVLPHMLDVSESESASDYKKATGTGAEEEVLEDVRDDDAFQRCRDLRLRDKSLRRRTRSLSPLRNTALFDWGELAAKDEEIGPAEKMLNGQVDESKGGAETTSNQTTPSVSASSSRCSSAGRSSSRWVFLKDFLRSKSEGRSNGKFWSNISFSAGKEKKNSSSIPSVPRAHPTCSSANDSKEREEPQKLKKIAREAGKKSLAGKMANGAVGKRRIPPSPHELHYTANRAHAEELKKKTFLPYRQGLLGCLGFSSKSYGAMNGFARALNPVSSR